MRGAVGARMSPLLAIWQLAFDLVPHPIGHLGVLGVGVGVLLAVLGYALGTYGAILCAQMMAGVG